MLEKMEKLILDPDTDPDKSQIVNDSLSPDTIHAQKFHEHSSITFWVILFNVSKRPIIFPCWKILKIIMNPGLEWDLSQNLIANQLFE